MPRGGVRPGAGRPAGSKKAGKKVKATEKALSTAKPTSKTFQSALEFAMAMINDADVDMDTKTRLAIAAMPYQTPRPVAAKPTGNDRGGSGSGKASSGRFATPAAPKLAIDNTK